MKTSALLTINQGAAILSLNGAEVMTFRGTTAHRRKFTYPTGEQKLTAHHVPHFAQSFGTESLQQAVDDVLARLGQLSASGNHSRLFIRDGLHSTYYVNGIQIDHPINPDAKSFGNLTEMAAAFLTEAAAADAESKATQERDNPVPAKTLNEAVAALDSTLCVDSSHLDTSVALIAAIYQVEDTKVREILSKCS